MKTHILTLLTIIFRLLTLQNGLLAAELDLESGLTNLRIHRDISGKYHPEGRHHHHEHDHSHAPATEHDHSHAHEAEHDPNNTDEHLHTHDVEGESNTQFIYNEVSPVCGCVQTGRCGTVEEYRITEEILRITPTTLVCGKKYDICCQRDYYENGKPWPGVKDLYLDLAPCVAEENCKRPYGTSATDVRDYGTIPHCPGFGSVRCLDGFVVRDNVVHVSENADGHLQGLDVVGLSEDRNFELAPCVAEKSCKRPYGTYATDIRDYGTIPQCPAFGYVRCLDGFLVRDDASLVAPVEPVPVVPNLEGADVDILEKVEGTDVDTLEKVEGNDVDSLENVEGTDVDILENVEPVPVVPNPEGIDVDIPRTTYGVPVVPYFYTPPVPQPPPTPTPPPSTPPTTPPTNPPTTPPTNPPTTPPTYYYPPAPSPTPTPTPPPTPPTYYYPPAPSPTPTPPPTSYLPPSTSYDPPTSNYTPPLEEEVPQTLEEPIVPVTEFGRTRLVYPYYFPRHYPSYHGYGGLSGLHGLGGLYGLGGHHRLGFGGSYGFGGPGFGFRKSLSFNKDIIG